MSHNQRVRLPPLLPPPLHPHHHLHLHLQQQHQHQQQYIPPPALEPVPPPAPPPPLPPPVQLPRIEPYLVLWKLAEDYFTAARKLAAPALRTHDSSLLHRYHSLLLAGLKSLFAVLVQDPHTVPLKVEMQTRLRIAEILVHETENIEWAEDLLGKGVLRIPKIPEFTRLKFAMQLLQAEILGQKGAKAARGHLKTCADEARERGVGDWEYAFLLVRSEGMSANPDVHEISQHTALIHTLRTMAQRDAEWEVYELSFLLEIRQALLFPLPNVDIEALFMEVETVSQRPERRGLVHLTLMRMLLHVLYFTSLGKGTAATAKLREYHQFMDTQNVKLDWNDDGKFELTILGGRERLQFQWFSRPESCLFGYLLSGIVYSPDFSTPKAWNFCMEGIRVADSTALPPLKPPFYSLPGLLTWSYRHFD
jgi:hypothetical protein